MERLSVIVIAALVLGGPTARAAVTIAEAVIDGRTVAVPKTDRDAPPQSLRIPSTARTITFTFQDGGQTPSPSPSGASEPPPRPKPARLRFRLDGIDTAWRDGDASGRISLGFADAEAGMIGSAQEELRGESAGWTGSVEGSPLVKGTASGVVPPLAKKIFVNVLSSYVGAAVGVIGVDDMTLVVEHPNGDREQYDLNVDPSNPASLDGLPKNWTKSGTKMAMSLIRLRGSPASHATLTIVDDEPDRYGGWLHIAEPNVEPGDRVTLSWSAAWSLGAGGQMTAAYRDLKPGTYFFRIGAFYPNDEPTGIETVVPIEVYLPWYLRRDVWAGLAAAGLVAAVTAGRAANVRRMKQRLAEIEREHELEQERARIARDLHDDVGAGLTEIAVQTDWLRRDMEQLAGASPGGGREAEMLSRSERVCQSAVELIRSVDAIVWAVNPKNDTLDRFVGYLTSSAEQFAGAAGIRVRFDVPDEILPLPLAGRTRHDLYLIVREAINNAVKHAHATAISLGVGLDGDVLRITVEDDGQGFDPAGHADDGRHAGLANMRRRAEDLGGHLAITSRPAVTSNLGGGTRIEITAKLA